ncbi:MAG: hypothetical protein WBN63_08825, partial [Eudoraea sp.]
MYFSFFVVLITPCKLPIKDQNPILAKELWSKEDISHNNYLIPSLIVTKKNTFKQQVAEEIGTTAFGAYQNLIDYFER